MSSKQTTFSFTGIRPPQKGVVVILAEEGEGEGALSPTGKALDEAAGGALARAAKVNGFKGRKKTTLDLLVPSGLELDRLLVVGVGKLAECTANDWMALGGFIRSKLSGGGGTEATVIVEAASQESEPEPEAVANLAAGVLLRGYRFLKYKTKNNDDGNGGGDSADELRKITVQCQKAAAARSVFSGLKAVCAGVDFARDLVNEPANILDPGEFAKRLRKLSDTGLKVAILEEKELKKLGMEALLAVGQGSAKPTSLAVIEWNGAGEKGGKPVAILGKGVCFDTGGLSLKPAQGMESMKGDMAGAATVAGLMQALAARKAKVNAVGVIGLVENMPSGTAIRPGDIIGSMSGQTIEVLNTDAEGRLVLADALWYTQKEFEPKWIVNLATLTGAILVALGQEHAGLFANDDELAEKLTAAGGATGEKVWRLPLGPKYDELIKSKVADMKNIGGRYGGSITAAQFLQRFIKEGTRWAHLDIAGTGMDAADSDINQSWGPGFGVRLLNEMIADSEEK